MGQRSEEGNRTTNVDVGQTKPWMWVQIKPQGGYQHFGAKMGVKIRPGVGPQVVAHSICQVFMLGLSSDPQPLIGRFRVKRELV